MRHRLLVAALVAALGACGGSDKEGSPTMRPGENCLGCHTNFTAAGTVYASQTAGAGEGLAGVTVTLDGTSNVTLTTNAAGNFYTSTPLGSNFTATVSRNGQSRVMVNAAGGCATANCHAAGGLQGRIFAP